jgi:class 3 adenylate cyclase
MSDAPETQFAWLGEDRIAYQVLGEGPIDLMLAPAMGECIDLRWEWPPYADFLRRLASFSRVIMFDRRGLGASDAASGDSLPSWERWADECRTVLDAVGSEGAVIFGNTSSGPTAILFAVVHADHTRALILFTTAARFLPDVDYPWGRSQAESDNGVAFVEQMWGTEDLAELVGPQAARDQDFRRWYARSARLALTPRDAATYTRWMQQTDVRAVLPSLRTPTLVLHRKDYESMSADQGRHLADHIPAARFVEVPGADAVAFAAPTKEILSHIEEFVSALRDTVEPNRALAAILFTDIVGSTERAAALGDREWRNLIETHDLMVRTIVDQHRGRLVRTTGDGMLATFDGPGRAIHCAAALRDALRPLGLEIRAGLHTGEIEFTGTDIAGIGVHIAARVLDRASAGQLLTSAAVPMLVAGSGIEFEDRGEHELKGVPGAWRLFCVLD